MELPMLQKGFGVSMNQFNRADRLLCVLLILFIIVLFLKVTQRSLFMDGLFFCIEAALVGGIADWFAVTALFKKPLGFPYHTALIPRKREMLIHACVEMVQKEFFSKKKLILKLKKVNLLDSVLRYIERNHGREILAGLLLDFFEQALKKVDVEKVSLQLETEIKINLRKISLQHMSHRLLQWAIKTHKAQQLFDYFLVELNSILTSPDAKNKISLYLENYVQKQSRNIVFALVAFAAQRTEMINYEEAAEILQEQLLTFVEEISEKDNSLRHWGLMQLNQAMAELAANEACLEMVEVWRDGVLANLSLQAEIQRFIMSVILLCQRQPKDEPMHHSLVVQTPLANFIVEQVDKMIDILKQDHAVRQEVEAYLYDLIGRTLLQAQALLGVIVSETMKSLSDEELNELLYTKVEQDLTWIRMNGSILGAVLGLVIFIGMQIF